MALGWKFAYRLGLTPWERAAEEGRDQLEALLDKIEIDRPAPLGYAIKKIGFQWFFGLFFFGFSLFWIYMAGTTGVRAGSSSRLALC